MTEVNVVLGLPNTGSVCEKTFSSLWRMRNYWGKPLGLVTVSHYDVAKSRNEIVKKARTNFKSVSHLLFVDSDILPPENGLNCLMEVIEHEDDVGAVQGLYKMLRYPELSCCYPPDIMGYPDGMQYDYKELDRLSELNGKPDVSIKGGGFGFVLVKMEVFEQVPMPWFLYDQKIIGKSTDVYLGEDFYFCDKIRSYGYSIKVDTRVKCGHVKEQVLW